MTDRETPTLADQIACAKRELWMRRHVYPLWVSTRRMTKANADHELARMEAIVATLEALAAALGWSGGISVYDDDRSDVLQSVARMHVELITLRSIILDPELVDHIDPTAKDCLQVRDTNERERRAFSNVEGIAQK